MIRIFATDEDGERTEITDLYWFEENDVKGFEMKNQWGMKYTFEIFINDVQVYPPTTA